jgi:hypothetical protein
MEKKARRWLKSGRLYLPLLFRKGAYGEGLLEKGLRTVSKQILGRAVDRLPAHEKHLHIRPDHLQASINLPAVHVRQNHVENGQVDRALKGPGFVHCVRRPFAPRPVLSLSRGVDGTFYNSIKILYFFCFMYVG